MERYSALQSRRNNSSSLRRAIGVLDALVAPTASGRAVSLAELATSTGLTKPTLLRLLDALGDCGLVSRSPDGYALGLRTVTYGEAYLAGSDLQRVARSVLADLAAETGETAHLVLFDEPCVVYVEKVDSPSAVRMHSRIGDRAPAYCTAVGKALLAWLPDDVVDRVLAQPLLERTPQTLTTAEALREDLELTRRRGWSLDDVENEREIRCVGAPVFARTGDVIAACSVSGPELRLTAARASELGPVVVAAGAEISRRMGAPERTHPAGQQSPERAGRPSATLVEEES